jgi:hypothetical protein
MRSRRETGLYKPCHQKIYPIFCVDDSKPATIWSTAASIGGQFVALHRLPGHVSKVKGRRIGTRQIGDGGF